MVKFWNECKGAIGTAASVIAIMATLGAVLAWAVGISFQVQAQNEVNQKQDQKLERLYRIEAKIDAVLIRTGIDPSTIDAIDRLIKEYESNPRGLQLPDTCLQILLNTD